MGSSKDDMGIKYPKPRDGHSCQIANDKMLIFGGDRHHMSFNDIIMIDLKKVLPKYDEWFFDFQILFYDFQIMIFTDLINNL